MEKSGAKFKTLKCSKQTLSPFPKQSTLKSLGNPKALELAPESWQLHHHYLHIYRLHLVPMSENVVHEHPYSTGSVNF
jgi:hypothetical protein